MLRWSLLTPIFNQRIINNLVNLQTQIGGNHCVITLLSLIKKLQRHGNSTDSQSSNSNHNMLKLACTQLKNYQ